MFLIALAFTAIGTAIGSILRDMQGFPLIMNFIVLPLFFFSDALYPLRGLPAPLEIAVRLNPLTYGVDGVRSAFGHASQFGIAIDLLVLGGLTAALLALGSYLFSRIEL
jgi:ABC-2 type transport system permease protein